MEGGSTVSMTKVEKALVERLRIRASLTLPPYEKPVPFEPEERQYPERSEQVAWFQNAHGMSVTKGWTERGGHNRNAELPVGSGYRNGSQGSGQPYRTQLEAYRAMRWDATEECMRKLAAIDAKIEELEAKSNG